jgi:hypothetical protein
MTPETFVILPDGQLEAGVSHLIPEDVPIVTIDHRVAEAIEDGCSLPYQFDHYIRCRNNGCARRLAACLALRSFPSIKTDAIFNEGRFSGSDQFADTPAQGAWLRSQAEAAGVSTAGKYYLSGLADFPGDPTAWVSDRGDVLRVAREKNLRILDGYVKHEPVEREPMADVEIAPDLIESEVADILDSNPGADAEHVRDHVYALRTGRTDDNPLVVDDAGVGDLPE